MADVARDPLVVSFADREGLATELPELEKQLDICQKKLIDFLEEKRAEFPRFYFIGDDDVLEVMIPPSCSPNLVKFWERARGEPTTKC